MEHQTGLDVNPVTTDRLDDLTKLFSSNGATTGCWCLFFLVPSQEYKEERPRAMRLWTAPSRLAGSVTYGISFGR